MPLQVKYFNSGLPGAPVLTGQVGSLVNVLDAVLVNGFNTKTISSITRSGSVATVTTSTAHGYTVGSTTPIVLAISGADQAEYNGDFPVTITGASTFTYTVTGTPASPATTSSTLSSKVSPLGWTKSFSGTNVASYKMPVGSSGLYLGVDDNQASGAQYYARVRGFETMTAAGVAAASGTGPFPTDAQLSGGQYWQKSNSQDATARVWRIVGDANGFWIWVNAGAGTVIYYFGDVPSLKAGDAYNCLIIGSNAAQTTACSPPLQGIVALNTANTGYHVARSYTQLGSALAIGFSGDSAMTSGWGNGGLPFPHGPDNGLLLSKVRMHEPSVCIRGVMPGIYLPLHNKPGVDGDLVTNVVGLPGATIGLFAGITGSTDTWRYALDLTGPWR